METTPEKTSPDAVEMGDSGLGLMLVVMLVLAIVAVLAT